MQTLQKGLTMKSINEFKSLDEYIAFLRENNIRLLNEPKVFFSWSWEACYIEHECRDIRAKDIVRCSTPLDIIKNIASGVFIYTQTYYKAIEDSVIEYFRVRAEEVYFMLEEVANIKQALKGDREKIIKGIIDVEFIPSRYPEA